MSSNRPSVSLQRLRPMLGTWVSMDAAAASHADAVTAIDLAYAAIQDIEASLHPHRPGSDLVRVAQSAVGERTPVRAGTWQVLELALRLHHATRGAFDPCTPASPSGLEVIEISPACEEASVAHWVMRRAPVAIDCGGIAKGYAVDRAIETLTAAGCHSALVNAGGDVRGFGPRRDVIHLRRCGPGGMLDCGTLVLENAALAVSDVGAASTPREHAGYYDRRRPDGQMYWPVGRIGFAAVLADDAMTADALTKCALLCEPQLSQAVLTQFGAREVNRPK